MLLLQSSTEFDTAQRAIVARAVEAVARRWGRYAPNDFDAWFARNVDHLVQAITMAQRAAVASADRYVGDCLDEQNTPADQLATPNPERLVGVASDGRTLDGLLEQGIVRAHEQVATGQRAAAAWQTAGNAVGLYVQTQIADAGRAATGLAITTRRRTGYVRMLVPPSCSRCIVLAGRYYRWSSGFRRHPGCNCKHIPRREDAPGDLRTDPKAYFNSLSAAEQARVFTRAGARAVRDGADVNQVVNARRGLTIEGGRAQRRAVYGRQLLTTTEGVTARGVAGRELRRRGARTTPRLMPEAIYEIAGSREAAIELLRRNGYIA